MKPHTSLIPFGLLLLVAADVSAQSYNSNALFSSTQGFGGWTYLDGNGVPMVFDTTYVGGAWHSTTPTNGDWCYIAKAYQHPGNASATIDSIRRWTSPQAGNITIVGTSKMSGWNGGDGAYLRVRRNGATLYTGFIPANDTTGISWSFSTSVSLGDTIDTVLNRNGNYFGDEQLLNQTISFIPPAQTTTVGVTSPIDYEVNEGSLATGLVWAGNIPLEFTRTLSSAGNFWTAYGGSRRYFRRMGSTQLSGCDSINTHYPYVVSGYNGSAPGDASGGVLAQAMSCGAVVFYRGPSTRKWTMDPPRDVAPNDEFAFHATAVHEFGHILFQFGQGESGSYHILSSPNDSCTMAAQTGGTLPGFCVKELRTLGRTQFGYTGQGYLQRVLLKSTASGGAMTWATPVSLPVLGGIGGGELAIGADVYNPFSEWILNATTVTSVPIAGPHTVALAPDDNAWTETVIPETIGKPTIVFDPDAGVWWIFARSVSGNKIRLFMKYPGTSGSIDKGTLTAVPLTEMRSKYPVGAAYNHVSHSVVLVWNSDEGFNSLDGRCDIFHPGIDPANWTRHCVSDVLAANLVRNPSTGVLETQSVVRFQQTAKPPSSIGFAALGSPSIACDPSGVCEIYANNLSQFQQIKTWTVTLNQYGFSTYTQQVMERPNSPGETDYPISVSSRMPYGTSSFVQAVTGGDHQIYVRSKATLGSSYSAWSHPPTFPAAISGPSVRRHLNTDTYSLIYTQE